MALKRDIINSAIGILVLTLFCGILYPLVITGISQVAFPGNADGQMVYVNGKLVGSKIIGQNFALQVVKNGKPEVDKNGNPVTVPDPRYFQTRPSATVPPNNAAATTFSNLGPNSVATEQAIAANIKAYLQLEKPYDPGLTAAKVPVDAANTLGVGDRPRHLGRQRRHPGSPDRRRPSPAAGDRQTADLASTRPGAASGSPENPAWTSSSSTWPSTA